MRKLPIVPKPIKLKPKPPKMAPGRKNPVSAHPKGRARKTTILAAGKKLKPNLGSAQQAGLPIGKMLEALGGLLREGRIASAADVASRLATKKAGWELAKRKAYVKRFGSDLLIKTGTPELRLGTNTYPKSYGQFGTKAPVSEVFTPKSPKAFSFRSSGRRFVDNRYRFDMPKPKGGK